MTTATAPYVVNDPRLEFDAAEHRYTLDGRELLSVTTALRDAGMVDDAHWTEAARLRGSYVHAAMALHVEGALDVATLDPALVPYFAGFLLFLDETKAIVEYSEQRVCDPALGYAGTLDLIVRWPARFHGQCRRTLIDGKTGSFPPMAAAQTAAYLRCARAFYPAGTLIARAGLHLPGDGRYRLVEFNDIVQDEADFMAALRVAQFRRRHEIA